MIKKSLFLAIWPSAGLAVGRSISRLLFSHRYPVELQNIFVYALFTFAISYIICFLLGLLRELIALIPDEKEDE